MADWVKAELNDEILKEWFAYAGYKVRDAREPFREIAYTVIRPGIQEQFATEGDRSFGGWQELSEGYALRKLKDVGPKPILQRSGELKMAMEAFDAYHFHKESMSYEPEAPAYAANHQHGTERMVARPIVEWTVEDDEQVELIFSSWLDDLKFSNRRRVNTGGFVTSFPGFDLLDN